MVNKRNSALSRSDSAVSELEDSPEVEEGTAPLIRDDVGSFSPSKPTVTENVAANNTKMNVVSRTGLLVLLLLALHNCFHTLLMRFVMKDRPKFLTSSAVLGTEFLKLILSVCFIVFYQGTFTAAGFV